VAAIAAAIFFGSGLLIGGVGLATKQPLVVLLGMGLVAGIGCGLGYIAPVSTLVKWFPDHRGMATGLAIMGFGGGAAAASSWTIPRRAIRRRQHDFPLGGVYFVLMLIGAAILKRPRKAGSPKAGPLRRRSTK